MPVNKYKPTSAGRRFMAVSSFEEVTSTTPERSLTVHLKKASGRNNTGRITVRHRGGGHTKLYRMIDFRRTKHDMVARVAAIEYDPNRSARIALLHYADGEKRYILAPLGLTVGTVISAGVGAEIKPGNALPLTNIPLGTTIHNLEVLPGRGGRPREPEHRQGGQVALAGLAALGARHGHEPVRPPARRRRGSQRRRWAPADPMGQAGTRLPHPPQQEDRPHDRASPEEVRP